eukprot:scaffold18453_cov110-Isochrysis_galbana.AAC.1
MVPLNPCPAGASVYATVRCFVSKVLTNKGGQSGEERPIWFASCTKCGKKAVGDDSTGFSCEVRTQPSRFSSKRRHGERAPPCGAEPHAAGRIPELAATPGKGLARVSHSPAPGALSFCGWSNRGTGAPPHPLHLIPPGLRSGLVA